MSRHFSILSQVRTQRDGFMELYFAADRQASLVRGMLPVSFFTGLSLGIALTLGALKAAGVM